MLLQSNSPELAFCPVQLVKMGVVAMACLVMEVPVPVLDPDKYNIRQFFINHKNLFKSLPF
jgi:hypothetical protein